MFYLFVIHGPVFMDNKVRAAVHDVECTEELNSRARYMAPIWVDSGTQFSIDEVGAVNGKRTQPHQFNFNVF